MRRGLAGAEINGKESARLTCATFFTTYDAARYTSSKSRKITLTVVRSRPQG